SRYLIRYLYPLIFCLPPLLLSGIHIIKKSKILFTLLGIILIACFLSANITGYITFLKKVKENHLHYTELIASLKNTGKKYWIADYWIAYLVTALTGEKIVVDSWPVNRYYPYRLFKYNWETTENFIFSLNEETQRLQYQSLLKLIQALGINFRQKEIDGYGLIYDLEGTLYPQIYYGPVPEKIPDLILSEILETQDEIILNFNNRVKGEDIVFKLVINLADTVHGWKYFSLADDKVSIKLPKPSKADLTGHYHLEYMGLKISPSLKTFSFRETSALEGKNKSEFIFLKGFGPIIELQKKKKRLLEKEVKLAIRRQIKADECLKIYLSSPFEFSHLHWYGKFSQEVDLYLNEKKIFSQEISNEPTLIKLGADYLKDLNYNPIITMKFKYHSAFSFAPFWKVAAFLEKIVIESSQPKS
ncbi:MAG: hypothetical protein N3B16_05300, partial [Candidatus Aminicenantes bacterium]|nr:hypothetical protein [Candidatus Aminicenantes bacterium]